MKVINFLKLKSVCIFRKGELFCQNIDAIKPVKNNRILSYCKPSCCPVWNKLSVAFNIKGFLNKGKISPGYGYIWLNEDIKKLKEKIKRKYDIGYT